MSFITKFFTPSAGTSKVDYQTVCEELDLQTGDILLMGTKNFWVSKIVESATNSQWSHVGMVLKDPTWIDPTLQGYYFWQSGMENFPDVENKKNKFGVRLDDLVEILNVYDGYVSVRKLKVPTPIPDMIQKLKEIHTVVHGKTYDLDILDFLGTTEEVETSNSWFSRWSKKTNHFFCSALVAYIYCKLGLLPKDTEWGKCEPKTFSDQNTDLKLDLEATLQPEISIKPLKK